MTRDLFSDSADTQLESVAPLAQRLRPHTLDEFVGQAGVVGKDSALRRAIASDRVPSMIFTLGVNVVLRGFMVMLTGGFSPSSEPTPIMLYLAKGVLFGVPIPVFIWAAVGVVVTFLLTGVVRLIAVQMGAVTPIRDRDVHSLPIPRMGGVRIG